MASIPFPIDDYPLMQGSGETEVALGVERDIMSDGSPRLRTMRTSGYFLIPLSFEPMDLTRANDLIAYLVLSSTQEFTLSHGGFTVEGWFWSDPTLENGEGNWWVNSSFYGRIVT